MMKHFCLWGKVNAYGIYSRSLQTLYTDGAELLNLAQRYGVNLSFHTGDALSLKATGLQGSLKRLTGYLNSFKTVSDSKISKSENISHFFEGHSS